MLIRSSHNEHNRNFHYMICQPKHAVSRNDTHSSHSAPTVRKRTRTMALTLITRFEILSISSATWRRTTICWSRGTINDTHSYLHSSRRENLERQVRPFRSRQNKAFSPVSWQFTHSSFWHDHLPQIHLHVFCDVIWWRSETSWWLLHAFKLKIIYNWVTVSCHVLQ